MGEIIYTPILKWRQSEQWALKHLSTNHKKQILPLLEMVLPVAALSEQEKQAEKSLSADIKKHNREKRSIEAWMRPKDNKPAKKDLLVTSIYEVWGNKPVLVDLTLIYPALAKSAGLYALIQGVQQYNLDINLVINLRDTQDYIQLVAQTINVAFHKIGIRITESDIKDTRALNGDLNKLIGALNIQRRNVYIIMDLKDGVSEVGYTSGVKALQDLDELAGWSGIILASGAFPADLGDCEVGKDNLLRRTDWLNWQSCVRQKKLKRIPIFADYTIRHPLYNFETQFYSPTCSLKYTTENAWWIMKGQANHYEQYLAAAEILVGSPRFLGTTYSVGDQFMGDKAKHYAAYKVSGQNIQLKKGNTQQWLRASINHHCTLVINQLADKHGGKVVP